MSNDARSDPIRSDLVSPLTKSALAAFCSSDSGKAQNARPTPLLLVPVPPRRLGSSSGSNTPSPNQKTATHSNLVLVTTTARPSVVRNWSSPLREAMESIPRFPPPSQPSPEEQAEALDATASELNYLTTTAADTTQSEEYRKRELDPISESFGAAASSRQSHHHRSSSSATVNPPTTARINPHAPLQSPCFVHSHLDNSLSFGRRQEERRQRSKSRNRGEGRRGKGGYSRDEEDGGGEGGKRNVTQVLAETASSVREMSKQLGRATVKGDIKSIMIVTKARDNHLIKLTRELSLYLMNRDNPGKERGLIVYVDSQLRTSKRFDVEGMERDYPHLFVPFPKRSNSSTSSESNYSSATGGEGQMRWWTNEQCTASPQLFNYVVTLGGDGTVLYSSWLFQRIVPPVIPFALGSLGFLTSNDFNDYATILDNAITKGVRVNLRMRFTCTVYRSVVSAEGEARKRRAIRSGKTGDIFMDNLSESGWEAIESGSGIDGRQRPKEDVETDGSTTPLKKKRSKRADKEIKCFSTRPAESFEVLNELVVDRGPSPYVSLLELFGDEHHMTTVQADGLAVSTPTGSTAYSLSAGGSLVHPEIPALLLTPICPHTLSFRPMLIPDSMELRIAVPYNSRSTAWCSFDGRNRVELKQGDHIKVTASPYPFPTVVTKQPSTDFFHSIARTLKWNERTRQKSFVILEEGSKKMSRKSSLAGTSSHGRESRTASNTSLNGMGSAGLEALSQAHDQQDAPSDAEEDETTDDEEDEEDEEEDEEEESYDIDDLTSNNSTAASSPSVYPHPDNSHPPPPLPMSSISNAFHPGAPVRPKFIAQINSNASSSADLVDLSDRFGRSGIVGQKNIAPLSPLDLSTTITTTPRPPRGRRLSGGTIQKRISKIAVDGNGGGGGKETRRPSFNSWSGGAPMEQRSGERTFAVVGANDFSDSDISLSDNE